ncbi:MAG: hypothetical protein WCD86_06715 [Ktedonobacteraceae bacterium]|nr:hypothetical protein [Ktedonobacteraceae bacterium]
MVKNEFNSPVTIDFVPEHSVCAWCGEPAVYELTAIGGKFHNMGAFFCYPCGEEFFKAVTHAYDLEVLFATKKKQSVNVAPGEEPAEVPRD